MRIVFRTVGIASAVTAIVALALCSYCAVTTASFVWGAKELASTVVEVERPPVDVANQRQGYRPVVQLVDTQADATTHRFSGLYRVDASAVGQSMTLLYNPKVEPHLAPSSRLNWLGSMVYGSCALGFGAVASVLVITTRRTTAVV